MNIGADEQGLIWVKFERSSRRALADIDGYRHEVAWRMAAGGYDTEALQLVETYCDKCTEALNQGDVAMLLVWHASLVKHLVWARNPVLKDEAIRDRQRALAKPGESRSPGKELALRLYRESDPRPANRSDFERILTDAKITWTQAAAGKWFTEARKQYQT